MGVCLDHIYSTPSARNLALRWTWCSHLSNPGFVGVIELILLFGLLAPEQVLWGL